MAEYLDISLPIVEKDPITGEFKATVYFEDYLQRVIDGLGGEGSDIVTEVTSTGVQSDKIPHLFARTGKLNKKVSSLEASNLDKVPHLSARTARLDRKVSSLEVSDLDKIPYLFALILQQRRRISSLETSFSTHIVEAAVKQLQTDTAPFNTIVKNTNYTARNKDYVEASSNVTIKLPENAVNGDQVMVANDDGTLIRVDGNGNKIKYTTSADVFRIVRKASSKHFHFFKDNVANVAHWRVI